MKYYKALYKCRYCGSLYYNTVLHSAEAGKAISKLSTQDFLYPECSSFAIKRHDAHVCSNGAYGFSDFIGLEPYDINEQKLS